jgi:Ran GTPase-activating protein (RanGAP) involved in mRNA processing and transport
MILVMRSLESNTFITHFLLGNNAISATGAQCIANFIEKHPNRMETWYLAGCHITRHGLSVLAPKMIKSTSITNLWFKRNPFGAESALLLADLVVSTKNLRTLDLETTELGDEGTHRFVDGIVGKPTSLLHLYLNADGIGEKACASLGRYLADPHCQLESLFLSSNPIGDAGARHLAAGIEKNTSLKRLMLASTGLTNKGVGSIARALVNSPCNLRCLDLSVSQTTKAHSQRFNYLDDGCISDLRSLIMKQSLRALHLGRCVFTPEGLQSIREVAGQSEMVYLDVQRVDIGEQKTGSCSLALRTQMAKNQAKYFPHIEDYSNFLNSEEFRYLRNTSDVRKIDSMYRTLDKRLGLPMDEPWEADDPVWKLITEDALRAEASV